MGDQIGGETGVLMSIPRGGDRGDTTGEMRTAKLSGGGKDDRPIPEIRMIVS